MDDSGVDFVEEFTVLVQVDGGGPLVSNSKNEFGEQVLVHAGTVMAIIDPFLSDLGLHFCVTVEGRKHSVHA